ncbi:MAG: 5'/3'-nucleotidase SurE, partial [Candidatus Methylomirabilis sp.]|nr:5'/3'-nucleotidase SurE [Deltaproteobacteria bacterium]
PYRITQQGRRRYTGSLDKRTDPRGRPYFWIGGDDAAIEAVPGSDYEAVYERLISITPLHLDLTNHGSMAVLRSWRFEEGG